MLYFNARKVKYKFWPASYNKKKWKWKLWWKSLMIICFQQCKLYLMTLPPVPLSWLSTLIDFPSASSLILTVSWTTSFSPFNIKWIKFLKGRPALQSRIRRKCDRFNLESENRYLPYPLSRQHPWPSPWAWWRGAPGRPPGTRSHQPSTTTTKS